MNKEAESSEGQCPNDSNNMMVSDGLKNENELLNSNNSSEKKMLKFIFL